eukprot:TRINITY_DN13798_c4_g1_i1.p1 TRINITY_DN13798_c4_g1~~TRINITY_DN13798_c4_g1_i1.p1  ORF type:complete len:119 (+),score=4.04 TRINITY_DN13798_c4_g1_i1:133-489(+)
MLSQVLISNFILPRFTTRLIFNFNLDYLVKTKFLQRSKTKAFYLRSYHSFNIVCTKNVPFKKKERKAKEKFQRSLLVDSDPIYFKICNTYMSYLHFSFTSKILVPGSQPFPWCVPGSM